MSACPHCFAQMLDAPKLAGQRVRCGKCGGEFQLPPSVVEMEPPPILTAQPPVKTQPAILPAPKRYCRNCAGEMHPYAVACLSCGLPPYLGNQYCPICKALTHPQAVICVNCGHGLVQNHNQVRSNVDPALAAVLGFLLPGVPNLMLGQTAKGIVVLVVSTIIILATTCLGIAVVCPLAAIDGFLLAKKARAGRRIEEWECF